MTLLELIQYVKSNAPIPKNISNLIELPDSTAVQFIWKKHTFIVKLNLQTVELKRNIIFITGPSLLMQSALTSSIKNEKTIIQVIDSLKQAEELCINPLRQKSGFDMLKSIKNTLRKLIHPQKKITK